MKYNIFATPFDAEEVKNPAWETEADSREEAIELAAKEFGNLYKSYRALERPPLKLVGEDGNVFSIMGRAQKAGRKAGWTNGELDTFIQDLTSDDYDHALVVCMNYFEVL